MGYKEHNGVHNALPLKRSRQNRNWTTPTREGPPTRLELVAKLKVSSLRKYVHAFDLDISPNSSKEDLTAAVQRHWSTQVIKENEVLFNLAVAFRKNAANTRL
ncbi:g10096 [Coccomyxa elongata]